MNIKLAITLISILLLAKDGNGMLLKQLPKFGNTKQYKTKQYKNTRKIVTFYIEKKQKNNENPDFIVRRAFQRNNLPKNKNFEWFMTRTYPEGVKISASNVLSANTDEELTKILNLFGILAFHQDFPPLSQEGFILQPFSKTDIEMVQSKMEKLGFHFSDKLNEDLKSPSKDAFIIKPFSKKLHD